MALAGMVGRQDEVGMQAFEDLPEPAAGIVPPPTVQGFRGRPAITEILEPQESYGDPETPRSFEGLPAPQASESRSLFGTDGVLSALSSGGEHQGHAQSVAPTEDDGHPEIRVVGVGGDQDRTPVRSDVRQGLPQRREPAEGGKARDFTALGTRDGREESRDGQEGQNLRERLHGGPDPSAGPRTDRGASVDDQRLRFTRRGAPPPLLLTSIFPLETRAAVTPPTTAATKKADSGPLNGPDATERKPSSSVVEKLSDPWRCFVRTSAEGRSPRSIGISGGGVTKASIPESVP